MFVCEKENKNFETNQSCFKKLFSFCTNKKEKPSSVLLKMPFNTNREVIPFDSTHNKPKLTSAFRTQQRYNLERKRTNFGQNRIFMLFNIKKIWPLKSKEARD